MYKLNFYNETPMIRMDHFDKPTHCLLVEEESHGKPWFYDMKHYLEKQEYPANALIEVKQTLRMLAMKFFSNGNVLYKRNYVMVLLKCVDGHKTNMFIKEIHEGSFGTHANEHAMAKKILRACYYWLTM